MTTEKLSELARRVLPNDRLLTMKETKTFFASKDPDFGYHGKIAKMNWRVNIPGVGVRVVRDQLIEWLKSLEN